MPIELDHLILSARDPLHAAQQLAELLGVPWGKKEGTPFVAVYVNDGLTLDFIHDPGEFPVEHLCFRVSDAEFDAILGRLRAAGIPFKSSPHGPMDNVIGAEMGGRLLYWMVPEGHMWEILTVSYARRA